MKWKEDYQKKIVTLEQAAEIIKPGDSITTPPAASAAVDIINAISKRLPELGKVTFNTGMLMYLFEFINAKYADHYEYNSLFHGPLERMLSKQKHVNPVPASFSAADYVVSSVTKSNVALFNVSEPDESGHMSLGPIGSFESQSMIENADTIIIQVNKHNPYIYGLNAHIHVSQVDYIVEQDHPLPELPATSAAELPENYHKIASYIVDRIPDGATIQLGLGDIANAVGYALNSKKNLGVHTEMITESMMHLAKSGVIDCSRKTFRKGKITAGFALGSRELYNFLDRNIMVEVMPISIVNDLKNIAANDDFMSINNALTVDLTGQVGSESLGYEMFSGSGGQLDFVRGSRYSKGGKSFIALESVAKTKNGPVSRICSTLPAGTIVTTPRTDVQNIVTEYGVAELYCKTASERVNALINIAHPDFRDQLRYDAKQQGYI